PFRDLAIVKAWFGHIEVFNSERDDLHADLESIGDHSEFARRPVFLWAATRKDGSQGVTRNQGRCGELITEAFDGITLTLIADARKSQEQVAILVEHCEYFLSFEEFRIVVHTNR